MGSKDNRPKKIKTVQKYLQSVGNRSNKWPDHLKEQHKADTEVKEAQKR
jgi:hypothetical protein